jgi:L-alanine-DL-glutamate epimerase-like enolase superfamily enzyme
MRKGTPTIAAVETTTVALRAKPALAVRGARTTHDASSFVLVRVLTEDGVAGHGEVSATAAWSGEDHVTATHYVRDLIGPMLVGRPLAPVAAHTALMDRYLGGNPFTKAGVNTALWDALGRTLGLPVATLLGGPFRDEIPVKISLSGDGDDLRAGYEAAVSLGFRAFKVKVGREPKTDAARVALARELAGDDAYIGVDANGGWTRSAAAKAVRMMAPSGIAFVEQPVRASDLDGMRSLRSLGVPVVADEAVYTDADVIRVAQMDAADVVSVYVGKSSGLERAVRSAALASLHGLDVVIGSNGEMGIGAAAQAHVACACERLGTTPCGITGHHFYEDEPTLESPLDIDGVRARLPAGPGLGVEPTEEIARRFSAG